MNTRTPYFLPSALLAAALAGVVVAPASTDACSIPVFRYALQFWQPDSFDALVFHKGEFAAADQPAIEKLQQIVSESIGANVEVQTVDLASETLSPQLKTLWETVQADGESPTLPRIVTLYPQSYGPTGVPVPVESVSLAEFQLDRWMMSPARKTITDRLAKGESAVWVVLEIGDEKKDGAAMELLTTTLADLEKKLELPEQVVENDLLFEPEVEVEAELRIAFSTLAVSRDDKAEKHFVNQLLSSEPDLRDFEEPMVFAVFGRGRALPALVGKGINEELIREVASFLVGPCSCQVKAENPGFDLLLAADWETLLQKANAAVSGKTEPTEITEIAAAPAAPEGAAAADIEPAAASLASAGDTAVESLANPTATAIERPAEAPPPGAPPSGSAPQLRGRMVIGLVLAAALGLAALVVGTAIIMKKNVS